MSHALQHGLIALFASALYAAGAASQDAADSTQVGTGREAIVLAQTEDVAPPTPSPSPAEPTSEPAPQPVPASPGPEDGAESGAEAEAGAGPQPQVEPTKKIWLGLMVIAIIAAVVWLFSRNKPKTDLTK
jgi:hypothetical protein